MKLNRKTSFTILTSSHFKYCIFFMHCFSRYDHLLWCSTHKTTINATYKLIHYVTSKGQVCILIQTSPDSDVWALQEILPKYRLKQFKIVIKINTHTQFTTKNGTMTQANRAILRNSGTIVVNTADLMLSYYNNYYGYKIWNNCICKIHQQTRNVGQCPTWWPPCRI